MYLACPTICSIPRQSCGCMTSCHRDMNFWQLHGIHMWMPYLSWSCCWWENYRFLCSQDRRATSTGIMAIGDFQWQRHESRHQQKHPLRLSGLVWAESRSASRGRVHPDTVRMYLPFSWGHVGPLAGQQCCHGRDWPLSSGYVSDKTCKQISYCILRG